MLQLESKCVEAVLLTTYCPYVCAALCLRPALARVPMGTAAMEDACCLLFVLPVGLLLGLVNAFLFFPLLQRLAPGFR